VSAHGIVFAFDTSAADNPQAATNRKKNKNNEIEWERRGALTELISYMKTFLSQNLAGIRKATQVTMGQTEY
jgi:hypothetical protein